MKFELLVDDRERYVSAHLKKRGRVLRLTVGDFAILGHDEERGCSRIYAIFERKTWKDLASSIKDGRIENNKKMIETRKATGCKIFYLVEGNAHPKEDKSIQGIPVKNMLKKIEHMIVRDDFAVIYTQNTEHTAQKLLSLLQSYEKIETERVKDADKNTGISGGDEEEPIPDNGSAAIETLLGEANREEVEKLLTASRPLDVSKIHLKMWQSLPGIGVEWSLILVKNFHIASLILGTLPVAELADVRTASGVSLGEKKAQKIIDYMQGSEVGQELLALVPRIGKNIAGQILENTTLVDICNGFFSEEDLKETLVNGKKMGTTTARKLISVFTS
nr:ERCC4 domain-containing protein [Kaumoebavirus]